jgi:hypothetical protein
MHEEQTDQAGANGSGHQGMAIFITEKEQVSRIDELQLNA